MRDVAVVTAVLALAILLVRTALSHPGRKQMPNVHAGGEPADGDDVRTPMLPLVLERGCHPADIGPEVGVPKHPKYRKQRYLTIDRPSGGQIIIGHTPGDPWIDVYARSRRKGETVDTGSFTGPYRSHGFHLTEERWSYGSGPPGAREIRELIAALTRHGT